MQRVSQLAHIISIHKLFHITSQRSASKDMFISKWLEHHLEFWRLLSAEVEHFVAHLHDAINQYG